MRKHHSLASEEDQGEEINLTPMLDVVFIMLIFFIVTATFIKEAGIRSSGRTPLQPIPRTTPPY